MYSITIDNLIKKLYELKVEYKGLNEVFSDDKEVCNYMETSLALSFNYRESEKETIKDVNNFRYSLYDGKIEKLKRYISLYLDKTGSIFIKEVNDIYKIIETATSLYYKDVLENNKSRINFNAKIQLVIEVLCNINKVNLEFNYNVIEKIKEYVNSKKELSEDDNIFIYNLLKESKIK